jgi:hypothetical protein
MDPVIFTGRLSEHELRHERPLEFDRLVAQNRLHGTEVSKQKNWLTGIGILFGYAIVLIGLVLLVLILLGQFYY